jgi:predicted double-glycine peptidase
MDNRILIFASLLLLFSSGCHQSLKFLPLNDVFQETSHSCGASAAKSILLYYGIPSEEKEVIKTFGTSDSLGTSPEQMVAGFSRFGLNAMVKENAEIDDIISNLENGFPTLVAIQAWLVNYPPKDWANNWEDGHWLIVIGIDENKIYFEDPSLLGARGYLTIEEFKMRWHDYTGKPPCCDEKDRKYIYVTVTVRGNITPKLEHIN